MSRILTTGTGEPAPAPWGVLVWRYDELRKAGYPVDEAMVLAERSDVDLHRACEMVRQGCPPRQAVEILL